VERQKVIEATREFSVMSEAREKAKAKPISGKVGSSAQKQTQLRFQPRSIMGARKTLSRVEMNAQLRGALDSVFRAGAAVS